jgi:SAM-dependent methyltransferase
VPFGHGTPTGWELIQDRLTALSIKRENPIDHLLLMGQIRELVRWRLRIAQLALKRSQSTRGLACSTRNRWVTAGLPPRRGGGSSIALGLVGGGTGHQSCQGPSKNQANGSGHGFRAAAAMPTAFALRLQTAATDQSAMTVLVLEESQRRKWDGSDDVLFYAEPRLVHHLDQAFRTRLTALYTERLPKNAVVLDLMSSWVSHLPEDKPLERVIGHGLNEKELAANPRLDSYWLQNLNQNQELPLPSSSVDATLIVAGWQYLQYPEAIASELLRVTRPGGQVIVAFSNRMFFTKAPLIWTDSSDQDHLDYVAGVLEAQGWQSTERIAETTKAAGVMGLLGQPGDPFFAVISHKPNQLP